MILYTKWDQEINFYHLGKRKKGILKAIDNKGQIVIENNGIKSIFKEKDIKLDFF